MNKMGSGIIKFIIAVLFVTGAAYIGYQSMPLVKLGLDLNGGVSITYQAFKKNNTARSNRSSYLATTSTASEVEYVEEVEEDPANITYSMPSSQDMSDAVYKMQLKAQDYSSEAEVYQEGANKINIDIPGVNNANEILEELGKPGSLYFVEGELVYPELKPNLASASNAVASASNATASNMAQQLLGGNVNVEGANVIQNPDGSITIGGDAQVPEGGTLLQSAEKQYDYDAEPDYAPDQIVIDGNDIQSARGGMYSDNMNQTTYAVDLVFTEEGKQKFAEATERNEGQQIAILYNGKVVSAPTVQAVITDGRAQITGMENLESAERLASTIRIGALPVELEELRSNVVGAKLGEEAISTSLRAGLIGFIIVCIFMIIVYLIPGFAASIALCMYIGLMLFLLHAFEITLTLPGIAGIILSIGMAVDANVIIFTRIKEEIGAGRGTRAAIKEGFNKALSAIMDGNITTLIAALVLFLRGTGSIKGFAATLALGIVLSLFSAIFVTRFVLNALVDIGFSNEKLFGSKKTTKVVPFTSFRRLTYTIAAVLIIVGIATAVINAARGKGAFEYGLDFKGGSSTSITFNEELSRDEIDKEIVPIFENVTKDYNTQFQKTQGSNEVIIKTRTLTLEEREQITNILIATRSDLNQNYKAYSVLPENIATENISGAVSTQMRMDATIAVIIASILMLIYIWFRFKDIRFASSAVIALLHDCFITIGCYAVFRWMVDSTFIACMLTIVGYSINATIVIFDRIRENLVRMRGASLEEIVNVSITQTFTRSINTSLTTFIMVLVLYIMGVSSIKMFALPLMIGIVAGAFSSIFITGPLWYDMKKNQEGVVGGRYIKGAEISSKKEKNIDYIKEEMKLSNGEVGTNNNPKKGVPGKKRKKHR